MNNTIIKIPIVALSLLAFGCSPKNANVQTFNASESAESSDFDADVVFEHNLSVKRIGIGVDDGGHVYQTFSYSISPANSFYSSVIANITFADNRNPSDYLQAVVDTSEQIVTITCLQAFDSVATLRLSAPFGNAHCSIRIDCTKRPTFTGIDGVETFLLHKSNISQFVPGRASEYIQEPYIPYLFANYIDTSMTLKEMITSQFMFDETPGTIDWDFNYKFGRPGPDLSINWSDTGHLSSIGPNFHFYSNDISIDWSHTSNQNLFAMNSVTQGAYTKLIDSLTKLDLNFDDSLQRNSNGDIIFAQVQSAEQLQDYHTYYDSAKCSIYAAITQAYCEMTDSEKRCFQNFSNNGYYTFKFDLKRAFVRFNYPLYVGGGGVLPEARDWAEIPLYIVGNRCNDDANMETDYCLNIRVEMLDMWYE